MPSLIEALKTVHGTHRGIRRLRKTGIHNVAVQSSLEFLSPRFHVFTDEDVLFGEFEVEPGRSKTCSYCEARRVI